MVKKTQNTENTLTVVDNLLEQIQALQEANQQLTQVVNSLTEERRRLLGESVDENTDSEQRAYELLAQLVEKVTDQRNAAFRKINTVIKTLIR